MFKLMSKRSHLGARIIVWRLGLGPDRPIRQTLVCDEEIRTERPRVQPAKSPPSHCDTETTRKWNVSSHRIMPALNVASCPRTSFCCSGDSYPSHIPILSKRASSKCASPSSATVTSSSNTNDCSDTRLAQWPRSEDAVAGPRSGGYNQEVEVIYFMIPILTELKPKLASPDGFSKYQRIPTPRLDESRSHRTIELTTTREMGSVGIMYARASRLLHNIVPVVTVEPASLCIPPAGEPRLHSEGLDHGRLFLDK